MTAPVRRQRARRGEGDRLRAEILDAASQLLLRTGDREAVSIRAVADAVGVTPPSIYLHFADKAELINAVCLRHFVDLDRYIMAAIEGTEDPLEELRLRGKAYVRFGREHPEQYRILFMSRPSSMPDAWTPETMLENAAFTHHLEAVQRAFPDLADPYLVAIGLWATVHGVVSLLISQPDFPWPDLDALLDHLLDTQGRGIASG